jgi:iron(III) transport system ATP-binding protein
MQPLIDIKNIQCKYNNHTVVDQLSLHVNKGGLACLLGPSGCGKTTVLRAIAGFEPIYQGEIRLGGETVSRHNHNKPPEKRRLGMVFQDYALFPHMTVFDNVCFGLRDHAKDHQQKIVLHLLDMVGMALYLKRYPHELSGGQQQRVALARALAPQPDAILLDEPFSNLDVDLRERLSAEVRDILKSQGITALLVTHDQDEAFALADQVGVMQEGKILQWDTPFNLYHEPSERFVADFIGKGVFLPGTMLAPDTIHTELGDIRGDRAYQWPKGREVEILLRPDDIVFDSHGQLQGKVVKKAFKGAEIMYTFELTDGTQVLSLLPSHENFALDEWVGIRMEIQHVIAFPKQP